MKLGRIVSLIILMCISIGLAHGQLIRYQPSFGTGPIPSYINDPDTVQRSVSNGYTNIPFQTNGLPKYSTLQTLPFSFSFYNQVFTQFCVSQTGILTFDTTKTNQFVSPINGSLASNLIPNTSIASYWGNYNYNIGIGTNATVSYKVLGNAPNRQFWIEWSKISYGNASNIHTALVLEEGTNKIYCLDRGLINGTYSNAALGIKLNNGEFLEIHRSPNLRLLNGGPSITDNKWVVFSRVNLPLILTVVSNGTITNSSNSYPNPFCTRKSGNHSQFIYPKWMLQSLRASPLLLSIALEVSTLNSTTSLNNINISLKNTEQNSFNGCFETDLSPVFTGNSIPCQLGWNNFTFNKNFEWDTTKNLLVDICVSNLNTTLFSSTEISIFNNSSNLNLIVAENNNQVCTTIYGQSNSLNLNTAQLPVLKLQSTTVYMDVVKPQIHSITQLKDTCIIGNRTIYAKVSDERRLDSVWLHYKGNISNHWDSIPMQNIIDSTYSADIPLIQGANLIQYYVQALDSAGNERNSNPIQTFHINMRIPFKLTP